MSKSKSKILIIALQTLSTLVFFVLIRLLKPVPFAGAFGIWAFIPLLGAISAFFAVVKGVNSYLAWLVPPFTATLSGLIVSMGYLPGAGSVIVCAFVSLAGSAAGDVYTSSKHRRKRK